MRVPIRPVLALALTWGLCGPTSPAHGQVDEVLRWNQVLLDAVRSDQTAPPIAARNMAMVHVAVYDAINAIAPTHEPYHARPQASPDASQTAAAASAAHRVLSASFPKQRAAFDAQLQASLRTIPDGTPRAEGIRIGQEAADAILQLRAADLATGTAGSPIPAGVGVWQPIAPGPGAAATGLGPRDPFAMRSPDQFRQKGPPKPQTGNYANSFERVKALGARNSTVRTPEQTQIAQFWSDGPGTATPPGHWNLIAQDVSRRQGLSLAENARAFALLNIALADAGIAAWDMKYTYLEWRPIHGIRRAAEDATTAPSRPRVGAPAAHAAVPRLRQRPQHLQQCRRRDAVPGLRLRPHPLHHHLRRPARRATQLPRLRRRGRRGRRQPDLRRIHWGHADKDGSKAGRSLARYVFQHHLKTLTGAGSRAGGGADATKGQEKGQGKGKGRGADPPGKGRGRSSSLTRFARLRRGGGRRRGAVAVPLLHRRVPLASSAEGKPLRWG
jgi:hypothetical protein